MISVQEQFDLSNFNTMGIKAYAQFAVEVFNKSDLIEALNFSSERKISTLILGGGSNLLFTKNYDGLVVINRISGIEVLSENSTEVILKCGAGENWHNFVLYCVDRGFGGIENLSLIPGTVGASPIQNIGAYGVEVCDVLVSLEAYILNENQFKTFRNDECRFGYRESIFKKELKGQVVITSVTFKLSKNPVLNFEYSSLKEKLLENGIQNPTIKDVSDAVIEVRQSKLPDPDKIGNTGSFFKNPIIDKEHLESLKETYPDIPSYPISDTEVKLAAGWLIEQSGWKGKKIGDAGVHDKQALVLVNHGSATGEEIWNLAKQVIDSVKKKFNIQLSPEVNIL